jgi:dTDP-4-amino-4,6-dideoxygalactose transaminase
MYRMASKPSDAPLHLFVPVFRIDECLDEIRECLEKGWTGLGFKTAQFEEAWARYTGLPHGHFVNSATAGLHLAVRLLKERFGWREGDEIISTPLSFVSTNHAILYEGLRPVFADVDEYLCLDPESVASRMSPRTRAVVFVGLGGNTGRLETIAQVCRDRGLALILDAAHMTGTRLNGRHVGAEGAASVFSFHAVKNLPTADAGMICFADADLDTVVRHWTWLGIDKDTYSRTHSDRTYKWHYDVEHVGFKYHGNSIMAALALVALKYVDADNTCRRQLAAWYDEGLAGAPGIETIPIAPGCESARHLYQVLVNRRDEVMVGLNQRSIFPGVHYQDNGSYRMYADQPSCPRARRASQRVISLPMHLRLERDDVHRICDALRAVVNKVN